MMEQRTEPTYQTYKQKRTDINERERERDTESYAVTERQRGTERVGQRGTEIDRDRERKRER